MARAYSAANIVLTIPQAGLKNTSQKENLTHGS